MQKVKLAASVLTALLFTSHVNAGSNPNYWTTGGWKAQSGGAATTNTVFAGLHDNRYTVQVCQHSFLPGKLVNGLCYVSYRGREIGNSYYNVLEHPQYGRSLAWGGRLPVPFLSTAHPTKIRGNAVVGGNEGGSVGDVYICRAKYYHHTVVGKFVRGHGCYFGYGGREHLYTVAQNNFQVLYDPSVSVQPLD